MIDRQHKLPIKRQAEVLKLNRSTVYYLPKPIQDAQLALMRRIDELHLEYPFAGSRMMRDLLRAEGSTAKANLARYLQFYNSRRPHSSLDGLPPDTAYFNSSPQKISA
jgi:hypothetical protein